MQATPRTTLFSLPVELRLQIAEIALEQRGNVWLLKTNINQGLRIDPAYKAASNLAIILVCRQFRLDFTNLAYQMTKFVFIGTQMQLVNGATDTKLRNLQRVVIDANWSQISWQTYPFDREGLTLEELCVVARQGDDYKPFLTLLQELRHVKLLRWFPPPIDYRQVYPQVVGAMYKNDHFRRYDAPGAPDIARVWWRPSDNICDFSIDFVACQPEPRMAEEEYMVMMKPKIDDLMRWAEATHSYRAEEFYSLLEAGRKT
jgi:hypothetical protein